MQQWEYLVVRCAEDIVMMVNGDKVGKVTFTSNKGESIWDYLNLRGSEGWEVVATATFQNSFTYTLKRLISQETSP